MKFLPNLCFGGSASPSTKQPSASIEELCHRFSLAQLRQSTNNFDPSQIISHLGHGDLFRGRISVDGQPKEIAVKRYRNGSDFYSEIRNEILILCQLQHPNLISLVGFCDDKHEMMVVYEYMPNGSLYDQLHGRDSNSTKISWKKRLEISIGAARGLHYLHVGTKRTIIHRDVKPQNFLLDENWITKLTNFVLSLKGPKYSSKVAKPVEVDHIAGTVGYLAPEQIYRKEVTDKSDVYSFGMVLLELICEKTLSQISYELRESEIEEEENILPHQRVEKSEDQEGEDDESEYYSLSESEYFYCSSCEDASTCGDKAKRVSYSRSFMNIAKVARNLAEKGNAEKIIDPNLVGEIALESWKLYMDIAESCLSFDPNERPHMGEVEVELERVLQLQEEADANQSFQAFL